MTTASTIATTRSCHIRFTPSMRRFDVIDRHDGAVLFTCERLSDALTWIRGYRDDRRDA